MRTISRNKRATESDEYVNPTFTKILAVVIAIVLIAEIWFVL